MANDESTRKQALLFGGLIQRFPDALSAVAKLNYDGKERWSFYTISWHLVRAGTVDEDGVRHSAHVAKQALAMLQAELEGNDIPDFGIPTGNKLTTAGAGSTSAIGDWATAPTDLGLAIRTLKQAALKARRAADPSAPVTVDDIPDAPPPGYGSAPFHDTTIRPSLLYAWDNFNAGDRMFRRTGAVKQDTGEQDTGEFVGYAGGRVYMGNRLVCDGQDESGVSIWHVANEVSSDSK
ncbi:MAG: hypothetical protein WC058_15455 [Phycisphaeraceae bacterium]